MRLGILSDTHGTLPAVVFDIFQHVDRILHAGDVGDPDILVELSALAPVTAVYGNTDGFDVRAATEREARLELDGLYVTVTHGDQFPVLSPALVAAAYADADVIVFGHTHVPLLELVNQTVTVMNPGSVSFPRNGHAPSVGIMELEPGLPPRARLVVAE